MINDVYEEYDLTEQVGRTNYQFNNEEKFMNWKPVLSGVVSAVIVAVLMYLLSLGDVFTLNWHTLVNVAFGTFAASVIKWLGTTQNGNFLGVVPVK